MGYRFIPDSYDYDSISKLNNSGFNVLELQIYYKQSLEKLLGSLFSFSSIDKYIEGLQNQIPIIKDENYNFYRKYSCLNSRYVYLRNNIHIERLTEEEIYILRDNLYHGNLLDFDFIYSTLSRVIFENGDYVFYGNPIMKNLVKSQSIVFEFAYNGLKCQTVEQYEQIQRAFSLIFEKTNEIISKKLNIPLSMVIYDSIPDNYKIESNNVISNLNDLDNIII